MLYFQKAQSTHKITHTPLPTPHTPHTLQQTKKHEKPLMFAHKDILVLQDLLMRSPLNFDKFLVLTWLLSI